MLEYSLFSKHKNTKDGLQYYCKECIKVTSSVYRLKNRDVLHARAKEWRVKNSDKEKKSSSQYRILHQEHCMYVRTKSRAKRLGIDFDLTIDDIKIPRFCPVLGIPLISNSKVSNNTPSIDKIIPELGYIKGNISIISLKANRIKSNATSEELRKIAQYIEENNANCTRDTC